MERQISDLVDFVCNTTRFDHLDEKTYFSHFFSSLIIMKWPMVYITMLLSTRLSSYTRVFIYWLLCIIMNSFFLCNTTMWGFPGSFKWKEIADSAINTTPIVFTFTRHYLFSMFYWFMQTIENSLRKMCIRGPPMMSKSCNCFYYMF